MPQAIDHAQLHRDIGALSARLDVLEKIQSENSKTLHQIDTRLAELRGGRKALFWLVSAAGTLGAALTWSANHIAFK